jgi:hypothetical protein
LANDYGEEPGLEDLDPRVTVHNTITGDTRSLPRGAVTGLDDWVRSWEPNSQFPAVMTFNAWQGSDDAHPAGSGRPGYRVVYKMIRTVPFPVLDLNGGSFRIHIGNGGIDRGAAKFPNAIPHRHENEWLVPQWGTLDHEAGRMKYTPRVDRSVEVSADNDTTPPCNYLELLYELPDTVGPEYHERLSLARARIAPLTAAMDLLYGERLLGPVLTEEVGEVFDDWHWNRWLGGPTVAYEGQARLKQLDTRDFIAAITPMIEAYGDRDEPERNRLRIASQWYWRADRESDPVLKFIANWLAIEALELGENSNIAPIKRAIAGILTVNLSDVAEPIGRVYGLRNRLLHGTSRTVTKSDLERVDAVTRALLERHLIGYVTHDTLATLRENLGAARG